MKRIPIAVAILLATPAAVLAQPYVREAPLDRVELRDCLERDDALGARLESLDREKLAMDRETDAIARSSARLADDLRHLDPGNAAAVADYNARSAAHNHRADAHNRRVADMNARAAIHNGDAADLTADCASRPYLLRDRDAVFRDRRWAR